MSNISSILLEKQNSRTAAIGEELDEPGVEADAVGGSEPDVLVGEAEAGRGEGVGLGRNDTATSQDRDEAPYPPTKVRRTFFCLIRMELAQSFDLCSQF